MAIAISIPVIKTVQAGKEYYSGVVNFKQLIELFQFDEDDDDPTLKAQRTLDKKRAKKICDYIMSNADNYVLPPVIATVGYSHEFEAIDESGLGYLTIPEGTHIYLCDGQHRREGVKQLAEVMGQDSQLLQETVPVTFFVTEDVERQRQIFGDINGTTKPIPKGLLEFYDGHSNTADIARKVMTSIPFIKQKMELQKTSLTKKSEKLFTFNTFHDSIEYLVSAIKEQDREKYAIAYWEMLVKSIPLWVEVKDGTKKVSELREHTLCSHGVMVQALGLLGANIFRRCFVMSNLTVEEKLAKVESHVSRLAEVNFSKGNTDWSVLWDGGRVKTASDNQKLASIYLGICVGLGLNESDKKFCEAKKAFHLVALWRKNYAMEPTPEPTKAPEPTVAPSPAKTGGKATNKSKGKAKTEQPLPAPIQEMVEASGIPENKVVFSTVGGDVPATKKVIREDIPPRMNTQTKKDLFLVLVESGWQDSDAVQKVNSIITAVTAHIGSDKKNWRKNKKPQIVSAIAQQFEGNEDIVEGIVETVVNSTEF